MKFNCKKKMEAGLFYPQYPQYPQIEWVKDLLDKERQQFAKEELKFLNGKDIPASEYIISAVNKIDIDILHPAWKNSFNYFSTS